MDAKTREALEGSIRKWEKILAGEEHDHGIRNCPLCQLYNPSFEALNRCNGCPVFEESKDTGCANTPYDKWSELTDELRTDWLDPAINPVFRMELEKVAQEELDFLKGLLP